MVTPEVEIFFGVIRLFDVLYGIGDLGFTVTSSRGTNTGFLVHTTVEIEGMFVVAGL